MFHVIPILCLIATIFFLEVKLSKEIKAIKEEIEALENIIMSIKTNNGQQDTQQTPENN